ERILQNEVILVALPLVGESVGEDAEIAAVARGPAGVAGEAILEPAAGPERGVLQTRCPVQKERRRGLRGTGWGHLLLFLFGRGWLHASIPALVARGGQVSLVAGRRLIGLRGRRGELGGSGLLISTDFKERTSNKHI